MKFISIFKLDPATMADGPPDEQGMAAMNDLMREMMAKGVMLDTGGVLPTGTSMRVQRSDGRTAATDGPFSEAKEVIGGFAVFDVRSKDEVLECARRFLDIVGSGTCDLVEVSETPQPGP